MVALVVPFPTALAPNGMTERLIGNTNVIFSEINNIPTTTENPGARWAFDLEYAEIDGNSIAAQNVGASIARLRGQSNRIHCHALSRPKTTGTLDVSNLAPNGNFLLGANGWTIAELSGSKVGIHGGRARLDRGTGSCSVTRTISLTIGVTYSMHVSIYAGSGNEVTMSVGTSTEVFVGGGRHVATFTASGSSVDLLVFNSVNNTTLSIGDIIVARAATTNGTNQTGSTIDISGLGAESDNAINMMDWIGINGELKRVVDVCMSAGGNGVLTFEPPLRVFAPNGSDVILNRPFAKFILDSNSTPMGITTPYFLNYGLSLLEDTRP